ncbi:hypothetical protein ACTFIZ_008129 [Dictyostelium cf. discoideum]
MESYAQITAKINTSKILEELDQAVHKTQTLKRNYVYMINIKEKATEKLKNDLQEAINKEKEKIIFSNGYFKVLTDCKATVIKIMNTFDSQMKGLHSVTIRPKNCFTNFKWKYSIEMVEKTLAENGIEIIKTTKKGNTLRILSFNNISQKPDKNTIIELEYITMICFKNKSKKTSEIPPTTTNNNTQSNNMEEQHQQQKEETIEPKEEERKVTGTKQKKKLQQYTEKDQTTLPTPKASGTATKKEQEKLETQDVKHEITSTITTESNSLDFLNISAINEFKEDPSSLENHIVTNPTDLTSKIQEDNIHHINIKVETPSIQAPINQPPCIHKPEFLPQWNLETSNSQNQAVDDSIFQPSESQTISIYKPIKDNRLNKTPKKPDFKKNGTLKRKTLDQTISEALNIKDFDISDSSEDDNNSEDQIDGGSMDEAEDRVNAALQKVVPELPTVRLRNRLN